MLDFNNWFDSIINDTCVFDIHEHFSPTEEIKNIQSPILNGLMSRSYIGDFDFYPGLKKPNCEPISKIELPKKRENIPKFIKNVSNNSDHSYFEVFNEGIQKIYNIDLKKHNSLSYINELEKKIKINYRRNDYLIDGISKFGNIKYILLDIFHSDFGQSFYLDAKEQKEISHIDNNEGNENITNNYNNYKIINQVPKFFCSIRLNSLLYGFNPNLWNPTTFLPNFLKNKKIIDEIPNNFDDYLRMIDKFLYWSKNNVTSFKSATAYEREIDFGSPNILKNYSNSKFDELFNLEDPQNRNSDVIEFGNFIMHYILNELNSSSKTIPIQIHTGMAIQDGSHPKNLDSILKNYQNIKFDLLHSGYPWLDDILKIISKHDNVFSDFVWLPQLSISKTTYYVNEVLKKGLQDKILGFGGDSACLEGSIGALIVLKNIFSKIFEKRYFDRECNKDEIEELTRNILCRNAENFFFQ